MEKSVWKWNNVKVNYRTEDSNYVWETIWKDSKMCADGRLGLMALKLGDSSHEKFKRHRILMF